MDDELEQRRGDIRVVKLLGMPLHIIGLEVDVEVGLVLSTLELHPGIAYDIESLPLAM